MHKTGIDYWLNLESEKFNLSQWTVRWIIKIIQVRKLEFLHLTNLEQMQVQDM